MWDIDNLQTLHKKCHAIKTTLEDGGMHSGAQSHPIWLPKPACPVTVVCGPPGSGKTTWAKEQAAAGDEIIDLDDCFTVVCGVHGHDADRKHLGAAIRVRNKMLASLAGKRAGRAYVIVSAPTRAERDWWAETLSADIHLIRPEGGVIGKRNISERRKQLAADWYTAEIMDAWRPPQRR
jgi:5-methylcytosine-specific restriction protein A